MKISNKSVFRNHSLRHQYENNNFWFGKSPELKKNSLVLGFDKNSDKLNQNSLHLDTKILLHEKAREIEGISYNFKIYFKNKYFKKPIIY